MKKLITIFLLIHALNLVSQTNTSESKVDYLEQIYFSGQNRAGLLQLVQNYYKAIELAKIKPTPSTLNQYQFLVQSGDMFSNTKNSCEVLDIISSGIYFLDSIEAKRQKVIPPSNKVKDKTKNTFADINKKQTEILSTANSTAQTIDRISGLQTAASNSINAVSQIQNVTGNIMGATTTVNQLTSLGKSLGIGVKKDKPCKNVKPKQIKISDRTNIEAKKESTTLKITFNNIRYDDLKKYNDFLLSNKDVVEINKTFNSDKSEMEVKNNSNSDAIYESLKSKFPELKLKQLTNSEIEFEILK